MPRPSKPWYRASRRQWFATVDGMQTPLGVHGPDDLDLAIEALQKIKQERTKPPPVPEPVSPARARLVGEATEEYLAKRKLKLSRGVWQSYDVALRVHLVPVFGPRSLASLTSEEIEDWADAVTDDNGYLVSREWSNSTKHDYLGRVSTYLIWAKHPLPLKRPPKESRGAEAVLSDEQFLAVLDHAGPGDFANMLRVLRETGARPQEIARLTAESVDWKNSCLRTKVHKSASHGRERMIYFNSAAMAILNAQRELHPTGHLFRTCDGTPYSKNTIVHRMDRISARSGVHATAYMGRHTFATAALVAGIPDAVVAELLGHRGTTMVVKNYGHVAGQSRVLREAVEKMCRESKAG